LGTAPEKPFFFECKMHALIKANCRKESRQIEAAPNFAIHPYALKFSGLNKDELANKKDRQAFDATDLYRL